MQQKFELTEGGMYVRHPKCTTNGIGSGPDLRLRSLPNIQLLLLTPPPSITFLLLRLGLTNVL